MCTEFQYIAHACFHMIDDDLVQQLPIVIIFLLMMACQAYATKTTRHTFSEEHGTA